jgi:hypothetical protein
MTLRRGPRALLLLAFPLALIVAACSEDIESGGACPALCPGQELELLDTVLTPAIVFDTSVSGYPLRGYEPALLLAARGDTLDVRTVMRFDSLARTFFAPGEDTIQRVVTVDSASLDIRLARTRVPLPATFTIDAYDVSDTSLVDSIPTNLLPLFIPERLLGTVTMDSTGFSDTTLVRIPIDTMKLREAIGDSSRVMRIGLRISAPGPVEVLVFPYNTSREPRLRYRVHPDTTLAAITLASSSITPTTPLFSSFDYLDYPVVVSAPDIARAGTFHIGGLPGARAYLRFELPRWLTDSSTVLRARLELTQDPIYGLDDTSSVTLYTHLVIAGHAVTDLRKAVQLFTPAGRDTARLSPGDSGVKQFEINGYFNFWRTNDGVRPLPNALLLRSAEEGFSAMGVRFFGLQAAEELRPRLRISYIPVTSLDFGQP